MHNRGTYSKADGSKYTYIGEWKNNVHNGTGMLIWPDGDKYEGDFVDGIMHGFGTFTYHNGDAYTGEYSHD